MKRAIVFGYWLGLGGCCGVALIHVYQSHASPMSVVHWFCAGAALFGAIAMGDR